MRKFLLAFAYAIFLGGTAFAQNQSISLDNGADPASQGGTYNPGDTFTVNVNLTLSGYSANGLTAGGLSYWLEVPAALAPYLTVAVSQYYSFTNPTDSSNTPFVFSDTSGADPGTLTDFDSANSQAGDLGATTQSGDPTVSADGTYLVTGLTFTLNNAPLGIYTLQSTTAAPKASEVSDQNFATYPLAAASYTIDIVPEPASTSLMVVGGLAFVSLSAVRRRSGRQQVR